MGEPDFTVHIHRFMSKTQGRRHAYSTLNVYGQIVWVYPGDSLRDRLEAKVRDFNYRLRSRTETDDEVRDRIKRHHPDMWKHMIGDERGPALDTILRYLGSRRLEIDE